ncbi:MAG: aspartyl protease family protein [Bacteroidales bacterium]|nr:aspartyl protease family protein [Bacteroidales bacterium]
MSIQYFPEVLALPVNKSCQEFRVDSWPDHTISIITSSITDDFESITIPLKRAGNLILLEAIIDSVPGNLILDTGSSRLVLNSIYFRHNRKTGSLMAGGITGSTGTLASSRIKNLQISEINFQNLEADITDLGHIETARNVKVLGFFGLNLISDFEVVIDLYRSVLELHRLDFGGKRLATSGGLLSTDINLPIQVFVDVIFVDGYIADRKLIFCIDTGAESNVLGSHLPNKVLSTVSVSGRSKLRGARAQSVEVLYGSMNDFSLGKSHFSEMNTIITNLNSMSNTYGVRIDGMLGCDFLEKGVFIINFRQKKLGIVFNKNDKNE